MPDSVALWTGAHQAPLSMGFSRQEYWSGLPTPSPGDLPIPGIEPTSPTLAGGFFTTEPPEKPNGASLKQSESEFAQSCLTPSDPMDCSLLGSSIHGIFQARGLEWVAIAFSNTGILFSPKQEGDSWCWQQQG